LNYVALVGLVVDEGLGNVDFLEAVVVNARKIKWEGRNVCLRVLL
jgi:hypothetical protein